MRYSILKTATLVAALCVSSIAAQPVSAADFKGKDEPSGFGVGALAGMGILDNKAGFSLLGTVSKKIVHHGFVEDIANSVSLEAEAGPLFVSGGTAFQYSLHMRWDFEKDAEWTIYALGGLGGAITGVTLGDRFELFPRFGLGAMWKIGQNFNLRAELSHEFIGLGIVFPL